jgi:hypothetical protein
VILLAPERVTEHEHTSTSFGSLLPSSGNDRSIILEQAIASPLPTYIKVVAFIPQRGFQIETVWIEPKHYAVISLRDGGSLRCGTKPPRPRSYWICDRAKCTMTEYVTPVQLRSWHECIIAYEQEAGAALLLCLGLDVN